MFTTWKERINQKRSDGTASSAQLGGFVDWINVKHMTFMK